MALSNKSSTHIRSSRPVMAPDSRTVVLVAIGQTPDFGHEKPDAYLQF